MANLPVVGGINAQAVRTIPTTWDAQWFKRFISDHMQKMDYRNAIAGSGITITGTEQTTGSISAGGTLASPVIIPAPATATSALTVTGAAGQAAITITSGNGAAQPAGDLAVNRSGSIANTIAEGPNIVLTDTANVTATCLQNSGGQSEMWQYNGGWNQVWKSDASSNFSFVNTGYLIAGGASFITSQSIQARGSSTTGFSGPGMEVGYYAPSTFAFIQGYNRTSSAYVPVQIIGNGITLAPLSAARLVLGGSASVQTAYNFAGSLTATSATSGTASALPATPYGYWQMQINGANVKIPYYNN